MEQEQEECFYTVIIPVSEELAYHLPMTLESVYGQKYDKYEVILVDGTKQGLSLMEREGTSLLIAEGKGCFVMINQALPFARGRYVHVLMAGDFYISLHAFSDLDLFIHEKGFPQLISTSYIKRDGVLHSSTFCREIALCDLKNARVPFTLYSYWFEVKTLLNSGALSEQFKIQGGFEIVCRLYCSQEIKKAFFNKVLADCEFHTLSSRILFKQFFETNSIIFFHFGLNFSLFRWIGMNYIKLFSFWCRMIKAAFWKENVVD